MKCCVIGLGRFGQQVATSLNEIGAEVLAVDMNNHEIMAIKNNVSQAINVEITNYESLEAIGIENMDIVIIAIGENIAQSILIAALIKKFYKHIKIIARATCHTQQEILDLLGIEQVILPEQETAINLADKLSFKFTSIFRLNKDFSIALVNIKEAFIGKKLEELNLYKKYKLQCAAIKSEKKFITAHKDYIIKETDKLILSGENSDIEKFL